MLRQFTVTDSAGVSGSDNHPAGAANAIKEEVKKKHFCYGRSFSCFPAPVNEREF
jgi:hypothetical protein